MSPSAAVLGRVRDARDPKRFLQECRIMTAARTPTIHDVARAARVSITTVSHALNGKGTVSAETRARVQEVAARMNYRADALARGLRRAPLGALGVIIRPLDVQMAYQPEGVDIFLQVASAASAAALDRGLGTMLLPDITRTPAPPLSLSLDGYIVMDPTLDDPALALLSSRGLPYVTLGTDPTAPGAAHCVTTDATAMATLLDDLRSRGARRLVLIAGTGRHSWTLDNVTAFQAWCAAHDIEPRMRTLAEEAGVEGARALVPAILEEGSVDAIVALTGRHAAGAAAGLLEAGLRIPADTMVVAASDSAQTRFGRPAISALEHPHREIGNALVEMLHDIISGRPPEAPTVLQTIYRRRASTARDVV